ncbi:hypothetical protein EK904_002403 [Melospiza melodia maxima]|nr:hypothetical protein EK904_002403 [Melospiza melodia maxima]
MGSPDKTWTPQSAQAAPPNTPQHKNKYGTETERKCSRKQSKKVERSRYSGPEEPFEGQSSVDSFVIQARL